MRKLIGGMAAALALVGVVATTAHANDHLAPGTPGTPSCKGQTMAFLAQEQKNGLIDEGLHAMGIGNISRAAELTVPEVKAIVDAFCAAP